LMALLSSEEAIVEFSEDQSRAIAAAVVGLGEPPGLVKLGELILPIIKPMAEAEEEEPELFASDVATSVHAPLASYWRAQRARERAQKIAAVQRIPRLVEWLTDTLTDLYPESQTSVKRAMPFAVDVSGLPVLHRGMSASVIRNQFMSLALALSLVWILLSFMFRSVWTGMLACSPTVVTLLLIYGGMGWLGVTLDIGTSMLASIIIGAGVDYAVHLISEWRAADGATMAESAKHAVSSTGPAIWTNAFMVAAGFYVLTLGKAKALQNVGWLTCAAMIVAALATFLAVPVLARKLRYR